MVSADQLAEEESSVWCPFYFGRWGEKASERMSPERCSAETLSATGMVPSWSRLIFQTVLHFQSMFACLFLSFPCCVFRLDLILCVPHILSKHRSSPCNLTPFCYHCSASPFQNINNRCQPSALLWTVPRLFPSALGGSVPTLFMYIQSS